MKRSYVFKRLLQYVSGFRPRLVLIACLSLVGVALEVAKPLPVKLVIDNVLTQHPLPAVLSGPGGSLFTNSYNLLYACLALLVVIAAGSYLINMVVFNMTIRLAQQLVSGLMIDFYLKLQRLSLSFYTRHQVGDLLQRISSDVFVVYFLVAQIILPSVTSVVCLAAMFYIMGHVDLVLACIAFSVVPVLVVVTIWYSRSMSETTEAQYNTQGQISAFLQQSLSSMKIIQAFGRESFMHRKLKHYADAYSRSYVLANRVSLNFSQACVLVTSLASAAIVGVGAYRGLHGQLLPGDLFIFLGYLTALNGPVNLLTTAVGTAITIAARGKRVFDIMDSEEVVRESSHAGGMTGVHGGIEFRNVTFGYSKPGDTRLPVLHNISFRVAAGQTVAIVGATGTGKTSLISLLCRFYDPWEGAVLMDGKNINDIQLHALREHISLVLQEPFLFPMTIAENIAFGNPDASFDAIVEAARNAQAHEFITKLPSGYETLVSETGASLSGGEKQRIAIARAFVKNASILIMDEPTSAVDAITEAKIFQAVNQFSRGKTVFLISHRLSTIKHADQIIAIKDGYVAERGTHQSLLAENNVYAGLYKYQQIT